MATGGSPGAAPKPAKNFYSLDPLEKKKYLEKQNDLVRTGSLTEIDNIQRYLTNFDLKISKPE